MCDTNPYLFVYGTLRHGFNHPMADLLAREATFVGAASCQGKLYDIGHYPGLILSAHPSDQVVGDVYRLPNQPNHPLISQLDAYEGYRPADPARSQYHRRCRPVHLDTAQVVHAWVYVYNFPVAELVQIPRGDYLAYLNAH